MKRKRMTKEEKWQKEKLKRAMGRQFKENLDAHKRTIFTDGFDNGFCVIENQGLII